MLNTSRPSSEEGMQDRQDSQSLEGRDSGYEDGQILRFIRVRFPGHAHSYPFVLGKRRHLPYGQKVLALSDRGMAIGYVNSFPYEVPYSEKIGPIRTISRVASQEDESSVSTERGREKEMETLCKELIKKHQLEMNLTHVEFTGYGKKVVFYFTAPQRVDFRDLVRNLVSELRMKIELRQIGARERAAAMGGLGPCGLALCCSTFLNRYGNISIKMAKVQNLSLVASKLNGLCGQLKCCLSYEEDVYQEKRSRLPQEDQLIQTMNGDRGKVLRLHVLKEQFDVLTDRGVIRRYYYNQFEKEKHRMPDDWKMPEKLNHVSHETTQVIGLPQKNDEKELVFKNEEQDREQDKEKGLSCNTSPQEEDKKKAPVEDSKESSPSLKDVPGPASSKPQGPLPNSQKNNPFRKRNHLKKRFHTSSKKGR